MKQLHIYKNHSAAAPVVYLSVFEGDGADVWAECLKLGVPPVTLTAVSGLDWDAELSPWPAEPLFKSDNFTGGAAAYLEELTSELEPRAEAQFPASPTKRAIAGYSMAGLFALYAACNSGAFSAAASVSGSLWFPNFTEYMRAAAPNPALECAYLSLGSRESKTKNPVMRTTLARTLEARGILEGRGVRTAFEENAGGHYSDPALRTAKGIAWLLKNM